MASTRSLLIPHKRPLLSPNSKNEVTKSNKSHKPIQKVLNPSAIATETRMKKAVSLRLSADWDEYDPPDPTECDFSRPTQLFLDPKRWEAMLKKARDTAKALDDASGGPGSSTRNSGTFESADQRIQRQEREAGFGSMAIRARSSTMASGRVRVRRGAGRTTRRGTR
ncbi:uncharacterized protein N7483_000617 [Penicillium malachiteum]|uniref:uncharacterized protein n=1 Tax=Penicillium malachiteum TaxID=1324776 RepID=UPI002546A9FD|nr:uncharacterized protein N7483_000617 [Penicillium malachiteum]KAJ5735492.1 hypothetical protein N7483_000617 [Penicillium malachiteum]